MQIQLKGKRALVSGSTAGIGYAIAKGLAEAGATVIVNGRTEERVSAAIDGIRKSVPGAQLLGFAGDLSNAAVAAQLQQSRPELDIVVNNLGIFEPKGYFDIPDADWERFFNVNVLSGVRLARIYAQGMAKRGWGRIVNIASVAGKEGNPNASHYSASKAGLIGLTKSLGKELAKTGIRVNCVTPATFRSPILKQLTQGQIDYMLSRIPIGRIGEIDEVAALVCWLASRECSFSTGATFDISGGRTTY